MAFLEIILFHGFVLKSSFRVLHDLQLKYSELKSINQKAFGSKWKKIL